MNVENKIQAFVLEGIERPSAAQIERPEHPAGANGPKSVDGFGDELGKAIASLDRLQTDADGQVREAAMGGGNLHEMAIALEKADIGLRLATKVRSKIVEAYNEIMRMGV
jgi:flagellar hook-basal body complex protein FliE